MINPKDIDWTKAPEGTTTAVLSEIAADLFGLWRKITDTEVYYLSGGEWVLRGGASVGGWRRHNPHVDKPQEAPLPGGLEWPKGMTYYNPYVGGVFFNKTFFMRHDREAKPLNLDAYKQWVAHPDTIVRYPGFVVGDKGAELQIKAPEPKKKVGWW